VSEPVAFKAGVLIIGSLLWDKGRQAWRDARLDMSQSELVSAPIRYGRRSGERRGHTYTMVFSRGAQAGHARVVLCSRAISSAEDLIVESLKLWEAEALSSDSGRIASSWGRVALLCNPNRKSPVDLLNAWAERVGREKNYRSISQATDEGALVSKDGILQIDWPRRVEGEAAIDLDLLLVTANDPTLTGTPPVYPSVETIVGAWNGADEEHAEYFWKNTDYGIRTFQDDKIRVGLRPRRQERV